MSEMEVIGGEVEVVEKNEVRQTCVQILEGIRNFDVEVAKEMSVKDFIELIQNNPALNIDNYKILRNDPYLGMVKRKEGFIGHDLGNLAALMVSYCEVIKSSGSKGKNDSAKNLMHEMLKIWPRYSLILQDICLRGIDREAVPKEYLENFNSKAAQETLDSLVDRIKEKKEQKDFRNSNYLPLVGHPASHLVVEESSKLDVSADLQRLEIVGEENMYLRPGETTSVSTGVVINGISNILRNAAGEYARLDEKDVQMYNNEGLPMEKGAKNVVLKISREIGESGEELVFRVVDDGKGMTPLYLDSKSDKYIFRENRSHRQSSGFGLTNMPERFKSMGVKLYVWTVERDTPDKKQSFLDSELIGQESSVEIRKKEAKKIKKERKDFSNEFNFSPSTVFEIRIPITKKTKL